VETRASFGAEIPMNRSAIGGFAFLLTVGIAFGQDPSLPQDVAFEVASVKLSHPGPNGWAATRMTFPPGAQRFTAVDAPLRRLIMMAYDITDRQILGGPDWIDSKGFDLDAKTETPSSHERMLLMLRSLLADRFGLTLHSERKDLAVEALSPGKHSLKLQPATDLTGTPEILIIARNQSSMTLVGHNVSVPFIAKYLSARLHRLVVDRTGLAGSFDFTAEVPLDREDVQDLNLAERDVMAHVFGDLVNSLGLMMHPQKAQVEVFTVEHAELPMAN
jgi:uncharacterized protein (TIGR03435 family)